MPREFLCGVCDATAEDVREVVDEPVGYRCRQSENEPWFFNDRPGYWQWEALYRHPQRKVVMPERANAFTGSSDVQNGWNDCLDEFARLNGECK